MDNKLIFNNREYLLVEVATPNYLFFSEKEYFDIFTYKGKNQGLNEYDTKSITIDNKFYGLKPTDK